VLTRLACLRLLLVRADKLRPPVAAAAAAAAEGDCSGRLLPLLLSKTFTAACMGIAMEVTARKRDAESIDSTTIQQNQTHFNQQK
jgi:hypothetical protein